MEAVRLLLDHNADAQVGDNSGNTPLHAAMDGGLLEVVRILLKRKAEINARNDLGATPLLFTSENGHPEVLNVLPPARGNSTVAGAADSHPPSRRRGKAAVHVARAVADGCATCYRAYHGGTRGPD